MSGYYTWSCAVGTEVDWSGKICLTLISARGVAPGSGQAYERRHASSWKVGEWSAGIERM
jgi:hypothetical protein